MNAKKIIAVSKKHFKKIINIIKPGKNAWKGAAFSLLSVTIILLIGITFSIRFPATPLIVPVVTVFLGLLVSATLGGISVLINKIVISLPLFYRWALFSSVVLFAIGGIYIGLPVIISIIVIGIIASSLLGAGLWVIINGIIKKKNTTKTVITISGLVIGFSIILTCCIWLLQDGVNINPQNNAAAMSEANIKQLDLNDPSLEGKYEVLSLYYGSGTDRNRPEYGNNSDIITKSVDGSYFIDGWRGTSGWIQSKFWGFNLENLPLNGQIWYPDSKGQFPLVLIVHGNHTAEDFSDPGYAYLGKLLASRGYIVASIDENFFNTNFSSLIANIKKENDARGWLLLEHLSEWHKWNKAEDNPFFNKIDVNNIGIIGHSRGGEAVVVANAFNRLPYYPDNAKVEFDYDFNIRSIVAIAPVDSQYKPGGRKTPIGNVNFLVLHGSQDGDVSTFHGTAQYNRTKFTDNNYWLKAALYIQGANHGQFNTRWGRNDLPGWSNLFLNRRSIIPSKNQEKISEVYISAFLESTLKGNKEYIPFLRDYRSGIKWLPETIYLNNFSDSTYQYISTHEEDINLSSTTLPEGSQKGENLSIWREEVIKGKSDKSMDTSAVFLGWTNKNTSIDSKFTITIPEGKIDLGKESILVFSMADANENPDPDDKGNNYFSKRDPEEPREPINLTIKVIDSNNHSAKLLLSHFSLLQPQIEARLFKARWMTSLPASEIVFQNIEFPLADFVKENTDFNPMHLVSIELIFDKTPSGVVILDDVGFRNL